MSNPRAVWILAVLPLVVALILASSHRSTDLPRSQSELFSGSGNCAGCHTPDQPDNPALRSADGGDVSPPSYWRSTMMANAAKDPFWRAKVSAEVQANPSLAVAIEDKCTTCHAPIGRTEAKRRGEPGYAIQDMTQDPLALDGVTCTVCHQIQPGNLGTEDSFSGGFEINDSQTIFGPYDEPFGWPMLAMSGYEPQLGEHMNSSALCATCHTLYTDAVDATGQVVGRIAEQTPYLEWLNSKYPAIGTECQTCHMPVEATAVPIANTPKGLQARSPFYRHEFVGGNAYMLGILRENAPALGVTAEPVHFDSTIARTRRMLGRAASLSLSAGWEGDSLAISVSVKNQSGHKLPTGYPSRRMWLELEVVSASGERVFLSGGEDPQTGDLAGLDAGFEPHQRVIRSEDQVQIYESIMADPAGVPVYGLLRASHYAKDNRIPPAGWTSAHVAARDTEIRGLAAEDADFNQDATGEGTGVDIVTYRLEASPGSYTVSARLRYQSITPRFASDLFASGTAESERFRAMYDARPSRTETVDSLVLAVESSVGTADQWENIDAQRLLQVYPNPTRDILNVSGAQGRVTVFDILGRPVKSLTGDTWDLTDAAGSRVAPGVYFVSASETGRARRAPQIRTVTVVR